MSCNAIPDCQIGSRPTLSVEHEGHPGPSGIGQCLQIVPAISTEDGPNDDRHELGRDKVHPAVTDAAGVRPMDVVGHVDRRSLVHVRLAPLGGEQAEVAIQRGPYRCMDGLGVEISAPVHSNVLLHLSDHAADLDDGMNVQIAKGLGIAVAIDILKHILRSACIAPHEVNVYGIVTSNDVSVKLVGDALVVVVEAGLLIRRNNDVSQNHSVLKDDQVGVHVQAMRNMLSHLFLRHREPRIANAIILFTYMMDEVANEISVTRKETTRILAEIVFVHEPTNVVDLRDSSRFVPVGTRGKPCGEVQSRNIRVKSRGNHRYLARISVHYGGRVNRTVRLP
mmetsp:Transcript_25426/g.73552  ORF Transcript_25426/g.73552 Transcript_25426/m.73552 type:complete len:337 (+) Transcript_25426:53-1063(+)